MTKQEALEIAIQFHKANYGDAECHAQDTVDLAEFVAYHVARGEEVPQRAIDRLSRYIRVSFGGGYYVMVEKATGTAHTMVIDDADFEAI